MSSNSLATEADKKNYESFQEACGRAAFSSRTLLSRGCCLSEARWSKGLASGTSGGGTGSREEAFQTTYFCCLWWGDRDPSSHPIISNCAPQHHGITFLKNTPVLLPFSLQPSVEAQVVVSGSILWETAAVTQHILSLLSFSHRGRNRQQIPKGQKFSNLQFEKAINWFLSIKKKMHTRTHTHNCACV